jgi:DNA primase
MSSENNISKRVENKTMYEKHGNVEKENMTYYSENIWQTMKKKMSDKKMAICDSS